VRLPAEAGTAEGFGPGNLTGGPVEGWEEAAALPDFRLPADHPARAAGIDLSQAFELGGTQRPPLPGMEPGYFEGAAPDLGIVPPPGFASSGEEG